MVGLGVNWIHEIGEIKKFTTNSSVTVWKFQVFLINLVKNKHDNDKIPFKWSGERNA